MTKAQRNESGSDRLALMGPPERGSVVRISGKGFYLGIRVDDGNDKEIVRLAMEMGERRRYMRIAK